MKYAHYANLVSEPVMVLSLVLFIALVVPFLLRNTKVPAIIGLILSGIIIGPSALNIIENNDIIKLFSKVGLLYIMFIAGLDIDYTEFLKNKVKNISFGILSFIIPFLFGLYGSLILQLPSNTSWLIGILLASNTLIAYPVVKKLNISRSLPVNIAISGTVMVDTIVLIILAFISSVMLDGDDIIQNLVVFIVGFIFFTIVVFSGIPKLTNWFFNTILADNQTQFLYVLSVLFISSIFAEIVGAEAIIGAFFAGLAFNRIIPKSSSLMNNIEVVGNTLFIPVFLISIGMLVNLGDIFQNIYIILYAVFLIILAISSKWLASFIIRLIFRLSLVEMNLIFSLSSARAAATMAIALIGYNYAVVPKDIFNAIILLIVVTSLLSSYLTEIYAKRLSLVPTDFENPLFETDEDKILVPISNPDTIKSLINFAIHIRSAQSNESIFTLYVLNKAQNRNSILPPVKNALSEEIINAASSGIKIQNILRDDLVVSQAIIKTSKELLVSKIIIGWSGRSVEMNRFFGNILEAVLKETGKEVIVCHLPLHLYKTERIVVLVPDNAENEMGFEQWIRTILNLNNKLKVSITIFASEMTRMAINEILKQHKIKRVIHWHEFDFEEYNKNTLFSNNDLYIIVNSRPQYISFKLQLWKFTYFVPAHMEEKNFLVIYPKQREA